VVVRAWSLNEQKSPCAPTPSALLRPSSHGVSPVGLPDAHAAVAHGMRVRSPSCDAFPAHEFALVFQPATSNQPIPCGSVQHSIMQPQTAVAGGPWRERQQAGRSRHAHGQSPWAPCSPPPAPPMTRRAPEATGSVQGVGGSVARWAVRAPRRGSLPFEFAHAHVCRTCAARVLHAHV